MLRRMQQHTQLDRDIELDFIREFSVNGEFLKAASGADRRERIRIAIWTNKLERAPFRDSGMNYGQAYLRCYGRSIEMRNPAVESVQRKPEAAREAAGPRVCGAS
jgi:hypothetical protein